LAVIFSLALESVIFIVHPFSTGWHAAKNIYAQRKGPGEPQLLALVWLAALASSSLGVNNEVKVTSISWLWQ
jgi:hypothetical protein